MKRLMVVAAAVVSFFSVGLMIAPAAQASTCAGVKVHVQVYGSDLVNLCVPG